MARTKGAKNKDAEQKIEDALDLAAEAHAIAPTEEMAEEIEEAVNELSEALQVGEDDAVKGETLVGHHPITKEPVYV